MTSVLLPPSLELSSVVMPASAINHRRRFSEGNGLVSALNEIEESQIPRKVGMMCFMV